MPHEEPSCWSHSARRRKIRGWHYELHFRPAIIRRLDRLVDKRLVDIVWPSTWSRRCTSELEPGMGFRHTFPVIPMPDDSYDRFAGDPHTWWRALAVEAWLADHPDDAAIWIDDDLAAPATHAHFAKRHPDRLLMIVPVCSRGLGEEHFRRIREFTHPRPRSATASTRLLTKGKDAGKKKHAGRKAGGMSDAGRKAGGARTSNPEPSGDILAPEGIGSQAHGKD